MAEHDSFDPQELDELLESRLDPPTEDVVAGVTPWRQAMRRVVAGILLSTVTLNFWLLNYILPALAAILLVLGFRALRREDSWLRACFALSLAYAAQLFVRLVGNTTILELPGWAERARDLVHFALMTAILLCLWRGLRAVRSRTGLDPAAGAAGGLVLCYLLISLLGLLGFQGYLLVLAVLAAWLLLIRSLFRLSGTLDQAGYDIHPAPVRLSDRAAALCLAAALLAGCAGGYLLGGSYPMDWAPRAQDEQAGLEAVRAHLLDLGFPAHVLDDLTAEDLAACQGALQVVAEEDDMPVNDGRAVTEREGNVYHHYTVYDVKELHITAVGVCLPGEPERWRIFHHFRWTEDPGFYGTEALQLWPAYQNNRGWGDGGELTGRVLYDRAGTSYAAPYHFLGPKTPEADDVFWDRTSSNLFAAFSFPRQGEGQRGYVAYTILELNDGWIVESWLNYVHQKSWLQYPAVTAMDWRLAGGWSGRSTVFRPVQTALQFFAEGGAQPLGR